MKEAEFILFQRKSVKNDLETIVARAQDMTEFLNGGELSERKAFAETFVREIVVMPGMSTIRSPCLTTVIAPEETPRRCIWVCR